MNEINYRNARDLIVGEYNVLGMKPRVVPGDLRLELQMAITTNTYKFGVLVSDSPAQTNTEARLNINDNFHAVYAALWVAKLASATSAIFRCYSYGNPIVFATANVAGGIDMLFNNSFLFVNVNKDQYIFQFSTSKFQRRGITQEGLGFGAASATPTMVSTALDEWNGNDFGYTDLGVIFKLGGRSTNEIIIQMPTAPAAVETTQRMILMLKGYFAINAAAGQ